jgi:hypothetical protein
MQALGYSKEGRRDPTTRGEARRDSGVMAVELGSGTQLRPSERPTLPPPECRSEPTAVLVAHIRLHTSMDELLYRLAVGDWAGAYRANEELEQFVPRVVAGRVEISVADLDAVHEFVLACVDGHATWGEIVNGAPFEKGETLRALCALVDQRLVCCL